MKLTLDDIKARESRHVVQTYKRQPIAFVRGSGSRLYDVDGREYLDLVSGIGVASLGHAHPGLAAAIADQASTLIHVSNLYYHPLQGEAAARLTQLSGLARVFFSNSGAEAVEGCLKFARRYWFTQGITSRTGFVAIEGGFAGRTLGALSVTYDEHYRAPFQPLLGPVTFVASGDTAALEAAVTDRTAAIIAEPIQGEGGIRPMSREFAQAITNVCRRTGTILIADEVQTGPRAHGPSVLLPGAWPRAGSRQRRQGAWRRRAGGRDPDVGARGAGDFARRSRQHLRRQPARLPRGGVLPRAAHGQGTAGPREDRGRPFRAPAARARAEAPGHRGKARRRPDAGPSARRRRDADRRHGSRARDCSSIARTRRWSGCFRR